MTTPPASAARRLQQHVYVDVPPSPYTITPSSYHKTPIIPRLLTSLTLKENTPLRPFNGGALRSVNDTPGLKRKTSENELILGKAGSTKKQKLAEEPAAHTAQQHRANVAANACPEFPNGFVYCHQCSRKRDVAASVHCTWTKAVKGVQKLCNMKMCDQCLKRRYGEDPEKTRVIGINGVYTFKCPKCRGICNCWKCRKLKGLLPTGTLSANKPKQAVKFSSPSKHTTKSTVQVLITTTPSKGVYSEISSPASKATTSKKAKAEVAVRTSNKMKTAARTKQQTLLQMIPQSLPKLKWTKISTILDLHDAEPRFQIREFILRFACVMEPSIPRAQLAELDDLGCGSDDDEMAPWVSDACVRSMILGLLGMLAAFEGNTQKSIKSAIRDLRATGNNLNKLWSILQRLRDAVEDNLLLSFPDPLPLPASVVVYSTRATRSASESNGGRLRVIIGHTAQMIPVLKALIDAALETPVVREELDSGLQEAKEVVREVQKAVREENERWDAVRKSFEAPKETSEKEISKSIDRAHGEIKIARELHKMRIRDFENALKLVTPGFAPRFAPLGTDKAGRVYWISSPGIIERKIALDFITSATVSKKGKAPVVDVNSASTKWPWFVAVWGRRTPVSGNDIKATEDDNQERWWAFTESVEIRKVADWIRIDAGIDPNGDVDANKPLASLIKGLNEYAALLDWRLKEDKYGGVVA